jgi:hypothetical protein
MTPAAHATAAAQALADAKAPTANGIPYARLALIHAVLSKKAGTGSDYTTAEQLLAAGEAPWNGDLLDQALAHAHLAA